MFHNNNNIQEAIFYYFKLTCKKHNFSMFSGNNFNLLLVTISSDRVRVLPSRPEIKLSAHGGYACSPNRVSGSRNCRDLEQYESIGTPPDPVRKLPTRPEPERSGNRTPLVTKTHRPINLNTILEGRITDENLCVPSRARSPCSAMCHRL